MEFDSKLVRKSLSKLYRPPKNNLLNTDYAVGAGYENHDSAKKEMNQCLIDLYKAGYILAEYLSDGDSEELMLPVLSDLGFKLLDVLGNKFSQERAFKAVEESGYQLDLNSMRDFGLPAV